MERERPSFDRNVARAVASLARNRALKAVCESRIERAQAQIISYLLQQGVTTACWSGYQVTMDEVGDLALTPLPAVDARQPLLPNMDVVVPLRPEDGHIPSLREEPVTSEVILYEEHPSA